MAAHTITVEILELDAWTADEFVRQLGAFEPTEHVVVDMRRVQFCDSSGIGALITAWRQHSAAGGSLCVINAADNVARGFRVLGLTFVEADPAAHRSAARSSTAPVSGRTGSRSAGGFRSGTAGPRSGPAG